MAKHKHFLDKYRLLVEPTTIITRAPDRVRIDLKRITLAQGDRLFTQPGQKIIALREENVKPNEEH